MKITIEDPLIYIYLIDRSAVKSVSTITDVNGYLIYDKEGNWLGYRIENTQYDEKESIDLPPVANSVFHTTITDDYTDILFANHVEADCYYDQECNLDVFKGQIVGIEMIKYLRNPMGKMKWAQPFIVN